MKTGFINGLKILLCFHICVHAMAQESYRILIHETDNQEHISISFVSGFACDTKIHYFISTQQEGKEKTKGHYYFQKDYPGKGVWDGIKKIVVHPQYLNIELNQTGQKTLNTQYVEIGIDNRLWEKNYTFNDFKALLEKIFQDVDNCLYFDEEPDIAYINYANVIVNFRSTGTGIDTEARQKLISFIDNTDKNLVSVEVRKWGIEGEEEYYFDIRKLSDEQQNNFVSALQDMFAKHPLVEITPAAVSEKDLNLYVNKKKLLITFLTDGQEATSKQYLHNLMQKFEREYSLILPYKNQFYGALGGQEVYTINLENLTTRQKLYLVTMLKFFDSYSFSVVIEVKEE